MTKRFTEALDYATVVHAAQTRKGTDIPYISHLLAVTSLVLEHGGDEDQAIAALLHDAAEDQGGQARLDDIRERFGDRVAGIVEACSDSLDEQKGPWLERKQAYLAHLGEVEADVRLISCADKLHNARSILHDYRLHGEDLWERFTGGREGTLWYYNELAMHFRAHGPEGLGSLLIEAVLLMHEEADKGGTTEIE